jgi:hypothetical protein
VIASLLSEAAQDEIATAARKAEDDLLRAITKNPSATYTQLANILGWEDA